ncbi:MAG TPA: peptidylprolyl isomerase [Polyangiaceae bacterium]
MERVAAAQGIDPLLARERAIQDALFASAARDLLPPERTASAERAVLARALLEDLLQSARAEGPVVPEELDAIVRERWFELDRPTAVRTTHAVVLPASPREDEQAAALAESIRRVAADAKDAADFSKRAATVEKEGLQVRVEALPFITPDGRSFNQDGLRPPSAGTTYDPEFARAANTLVQVGSLSPVTKTRFGYHVIYLEERLAEHRLTPHARELLSPNAIAKRAARAEAALLKQLEASVPREIVRAVDELTAHVPTKP